MLAAFRAQDRGLLVALRHGDGRLLLAFRFRHDRAACALCRHLPGHRFLNLARRQDFTNLHSGHLVAPAFGYLVEFLAKHGVDVLALRQDIVQHNIADDRAQRRRRDALRRGGKVADLDHAGDRIDDLPVNQKVDRDVRVVFGDRRLVRHLQELLAQVDPVRILDERNQEDQSWPALPHALAKPENDEALVLAHDFDRQRDEHDGEQDQKEPNARDKE